MSAQKYFLSVVLLVSACGSLPEEPSANEELAATRQPLTGALAYRGVNLCGAEFGVDAWGNGALPGTFGTSYTYPDPTYSAGYTSADYYVAKGMTTFRLPFRWERLQPRRGQAFDAAELARLKTTVNRLLAKRAAVILNPQNFARYGTSLIGSTEVPNAQFADFWARLANEFKGSPNVLFGLVNEPHDIGTEQWVRAANAAISAIRGTGATNLVLVPGNGWTGAHSWTSSYYGTPNSTALLDIVDAKNNYAFEVHQYLDDDASGGGASCVSAAIGSQRMADFTRWLRANGKRGFLGEFGGANNGTCLAAIDDILRHVEANADVYLGWTYWAGGPWWKGYMLSLEPADSSDSAQMKALLPHLAWTAPPAPAACAATTYEAETMDHEVGGPTTGGWNVWSSGGISKTHAFAAGRTTVTVTASGQAAGGVAPRMSVSVGGRVIGQATVSSANFAPYSFTFDATAGTQAVRVSFDNDGLVGTEDRNLLVDKIVVGCPAATCTARTLEAEAMGHDVGGPTTGGWNLWSNGSVYASPTFASSESSITVRAGGQSAGGVWPHFVVSVGGQPIGSASATSTSFRDYVFPITATSGSKEVRVTFDNDAQVSGADRNLLLDRVVLGCP